MASSASVPASPRRFVRRALLCCAGLLALWLVGQAVPAVASGEPSARATQAVADSSAAHDSTANGSVAGSSEAGSNAAGSNAAAGDSAASVAGGAQGAAPADRSGGRRGVLSSGGEGGNTFSFGWGHAAAILLLAGGAAYALWLQRGGGAAAATRTFRPVGQYALGAQDQQVRLVECGGEVLLLGVTAQEVTLLKTYPREAFEGHPALAEEPADSEAQAAAAWPEGGLPGALRRVLQQRASA